MTPTRDRSARPHAAVLAVLVAAVVVDWPAVLVAVVPAVWPAVVAALVVALIVAWVVRPGPVRDPRL